MKSKRLKRVRIFHYIKLKEFTNISDGNVRTGEAHYLFMISNWFCIYLSKSLAIKKENVGHGDFTIDNVLQNFDTQLLKITFESFYKVEANNIANVNGLYIQLLPTELSINQKETQIMNWNYYSCKNKRNYCFTWWWTWSSLNIINQLVETCIAYSLVVIFRQQIRLI